MHNLMIVLGSVRRGRVGLPIAEWALRRAEIDGRFHIDFVDLADLALPFMDEPNHPRLRQYTRDYTKEWSSRVDAADAFLFVFPEYNHSYSPAIKNAIDYLHAEWARKPIGFINWGGNSGGTRAQAALRPVVASLGMVMTQGNIEINMPWDQIEGSVFDPTEQQSAVLQAQFDDMLTLIAALRSPRPDALPVGA
jgi:NAD(P)H-dependent FMN reductase